MEQLKTYLNDHPAELPDWIEQFPWELFDNERTITEDMDAEIIVAKRVILESESEVSKIILCHDAVINDAAEIHGTLVCYRASIKQNAECNYLIARSAEIGVDAEIQSAIILDSLKLDVGAEINNLDLVEFTFLDYHQESEVKQTNKKSTAGFTLMVEQRLNLVLESIMSFQAPS